MENKTQNIFEKLDKQGEQIEDISKILEGVSINDLYALAKRTWDYGDFQMAQKYYNHISLLNPLDWEAPLYASLCNFRGYHDIYFWINVPEQVEIIIISTIKYINNLELDNEKKELEISKCIEIIKDAMLRIKNHYFKYQEEYDRRKGNFIYVLEDFYFNIYNEIRNIDLKSIKEFNIVLVEGIISLIESTGRRSPKISKEVYEELSSSFVKKIDIDHANVSENNKKSKITKYDLSFDEIKEIKLKGVKYFEYNDKLKLKRINRGNLIIGLLMTIFSTGGMVLSALGEWYWFFACLFPFIFGILLIIKSITQKERIKCSSFLNAHREKNRLTSSGGVVSETRFSFMGVFAFYIIILSTSYGMFMAILSNNNVYHLLFLVINAINYIMNLICYKLRNYYKSEGIYLYYYRDKFFDLD